MVDEGGTSWWLDTLRPTLLQALLDMTVQLRNVTVCCQAGGVTASLAFSALDAATALDPDAARRPVSTAHRPLPILAALGQFCISIVSTAQRDYPREANSGFRNSFNMLVCVQTSTAADERP